MLIDTKFSNISSTYFLLWNSEFYAEMIFQRNFFCCLEEKLQNAAHYIFPQHHSCQKIFVLSNLRQNWSTLRHFSDHCTYFYRFLWTLAVTQLWSKSRNLTCRLFKASCLSCRLPVAVIRERCKCAQFSSAIPTFYTHNSVIHIALII